MNKGCIVVFGGAGFIGTHLLEFLSRTTSSRLISIDIREPRKQVRGVEYRSGDVRILTGFEFNEPIERIYNLAAVHTTPGHPSHEYYETNILGATEVTNFASRHNVSSIVFTSSISVYGPSEEAKSEQTPPAPASPYGWSKFLAERIHQKWQSERASRRLVIVRPAVVFGPGEGGNFTRLAKIMKRGVFIFPGRSDTVKACIYVSDLIEAIAYAEAQEDPLIVFNGCYPDRYSIGDIVQELHRQHFPRTITFVAPQLALRAAAAALQPFSLFGLDIHPDRITKLTKSTDIEPMWLIKNGQARYGQLPMALADWSKQTSGEFC